MAMPNLTFVTHENKEALREAPELRGYFAEQDRLKAQREAAEKAKGEKPDA